MESDFEQEDLESSAASASETLPLEVPAAASRGNAGGWGAAAEATQQPPLPPQGSGKAAEADGEAGEWDEDAPDSGGDSEWPVDAVDGDSEDGVSSQTPFFLCFLRRSVDYLAPCCVRMCKSTSMPQNLPAKA